MTAYPLPSAFVDRMREQLGTDVERYLETLDEPYLRGLRLNPRKPCSLPDTLAADVGEPVPWWPTYGRYLAQESTAGADPLHEAGAYYLQEPSAMSPVAVLAPKAGERVLDLCAAPGGKSTQIADALAGTGLLVCNEPVPSRSKTLARNIERMGVANALVVSAEPESLCERWTSAFDAVLVDAPCSGEGMFRRHPETRAEWNPSAPEGCAARQRHILSCACRMLKAGGRLVYSTCTLNRVENEETAAWLVSQPFGMVLRPFSLPSVGETREGYAHLYPHEVQGEGHFVALFEKTIDTDPPCEFVKPDIALARVDTAMRSAYDQLRKGFAFGGETLPEPNARFADTLIHAPELPPLRGVKVLQAGLPLATVKGQSGLLTPHHALAMALPQPLALPTLPLTREQAILYQAGEVLPAPETLTGYVVPTYQALPLGFGRAGGGQCKNHYPKGIRRR